VGGKKSRGRWPHSGREGRGKAEVNALSGSQEKREDLKSIGGFSKNKKGVSKSHYIAEKRKDQRKHFAGGKKGDE